MALSEKQERFAQEYTKDLNATKAAIRAGYSEKTAHLQGANLLRNKGIHERIAELQEEHAKETLVTVEYVLKGLIANHEMAMNKERISDSNKSLELLGKHLGMFTDKIESMSTHKHSGNIQWWIDDQADA